MIVSFCQSDKHWGSMKLGRTDLTIARFGCLLTSIAMLDGHFPSIINEIFTAKNVYVDKDGILDPYYLDDYLIDCGKAAKALGMVYKYQKTNPGKTCIAETNFYKSKGFLQHFFVLLANGHIVDPITGLQGSNKYARKMVSYRLFERA